MRRRGSATPKVVSFVRPQRGGGGACDKASDWKKVRRCIRYMRHLVAVAVALCPLIAPLLPHSFM